MGKRSKNPDQIVGMDDASCTVCTMMWCPDGTIAVLGNFDSIVSFHKDFPEAATEFIRACRGIEAGLKYEDADRAENLIKVFMDLNRKHFMAAQLVDPAKLKKFTSTSQLAVQFSRCGKNSYILHNMEDFRYLSSLAEIETLVPELFLSSPKIPIKILEQDSGHGQPWRDPEILKMIEEMKSEPVR